MGCFVRGGKSLWDVLPRVAKKGMGCFVECRTFRPQTFRPRTFRPGHFGHGRFGPDISATDVLATENAKGGHFGQNHKLWVGVCACINA